MTYTTNYSLHKPSIEDNFNLNDLNTNSDLIDSQLVGSSADIPLVTCSTAAGTLVKEVSIPGVVHLRKGLRFLMTLSNTNTKAGVVNLQVNYLGSKPIFVNGVQITGSNPGTLAAGTYLVEYDGTQFKLTTSTYTTDNARIAGNVTGTVTVGHGGTGNTTLTNNAILLGNGTSAVKNGAVIGTGTTTYLRNDGQWGTPAGTTYDTITQTEITAGTSTSSRLVTPKLLGDNFIKKTDLLDMIYPIGSLYWSSNSTDPGTLFGGTWTQIKDTFVWAKGDSDTVNATGGEKTHTLTESEMPSHSHSFTPAGKIASTSGGTDNKVASESAHTHDFTHTHGYTPAGKIASTSGGTDNKTSTPNDSTVTITDPGHKHTYNYRESGSGSSSMGGTRDTSFPSRSTGTSTTNITATHSHTHAAYFTGTAGTTTSQSTTTSGAGSAHSHTAYFTGTAGTTGTKGSGTAHNNMPPYIVKYCWERTA